MKFQIVTVICPQCGEKGFHPDVDGCLDAQRAAIKVRLTPGQQGTRTRALKYLRRDRCDLPQTNITKKI